MAKWIRQPQEQEGSYHFSGTFYVTRGVQELLSQEEKFAIYQEIQILEKENEGLDSLQTYLAEGEEKLFFIDQLSKQMIESGDYIEEYNYCTLLLNTNYYTN